MINPVVKNSLETRGGFQEKACDFGHEKGLMAVYKLILQTQRIRFSPGVGLGLSGLPTQGLFGA